MSIFRVNSTTSEAQRGNEILFFAIRLSGNLIIRSECFANTSDNRVWTLQSNEHFKFMKKQTSKFAFVCLMANFLAFFQRT